VLAELVFDTSRATTEYTRNFIRASLEHLFPDLLSPPVDDSVSWKVAPRKTKLPIGRKNNKLACDRSEGPTGKAITGRYDVLNTRNPSTVEFRLFKGTMNPDSVYRYLEFVDAIVRFVGMTSATNSGVSYDAFINWLTKDSFNVLRYNHLVAFLVAKEYIERKRIRKRDLPIMMEDDSQVPADAPTLTIPQAVPVTNVQTLDVVMSSGLTPTPEVTDWFAVATEDGDDSNYVYGEESCQCPSCRYGRGEISVEEYDQHVANGTEFDGA